MRDVLKRLMGWGRDDAFDDLRRSLASHRARAARSEVAVIARTRQIETGHYLGDRVGQRISAPEASPLITSYSASRGGDDGDG